MKLIVLIVLMWLPLRVLCGGLMFQHVESSVVSHKTSYDVFVNKKVAFADVVNISFDLEVYNIHSLGNVVRVKDSHSNNVYLLAFSYDDDTYSHFKFNIEGKDNRITYTIPNNIIGPGRWQTVTMKFDLAKDIVEITIGGQRFVTSDLQLPSPPETFSPQIIFGCIGYEDVAGFSIRNVKVADNAQSFLFPLNESAGTDVHSYPDKSKVGRVENPIWLINSSYHWKKSFSYSSKSVAGYNFDYKTAEVIIFNADSIVRYNTVEDSVSAKRYLAGQPLGMRLGTNFYDTVANKIYAYEVNNLPPDAEMMSVLDLNTLTWTPRSYKYLPTQRHHHASYFNSKNSQYTIFGGFGNRAYSKEFVRYDIGSDQWTALNFTGDQIHPRFSPAIGVLDDNTCLMFGGLGNITGDQTVGLDFYHDLYRISVKDRTIKRLWNVELDGLPIVPVRNMVISDDGEYFYAMCYPMLEPESHLKLYKFSIDDGSYEILGDSIPIVSTAITSNANLYYSADRSKFYCVVQEFQNSGESEITIYTLSAPAVVESDLSIYSSEWPVYLKWIAIAAILLVVLMAVIVLKRRKQPTTSVVTQDLHKPIAPTAVPVKVHHSVMKNAIYIFGEFRVYDRSGKDITYMFSNKIRQLLVLIMLKSGDNGIGVGSAEITDALWSDRSARDAKNLKGVTMNHLRKSLKELDGIEVVFEDNLFRVKLTDDFYCDYYHYIHSVSQQGVYDEYASVLTRGRFLQSFDSDTFDSFKRKFEEQTLRNIPLELARYYSEGDYKNVVKLVSALHTVDPYSEVALWYEIRSLRQLRKNDEARSRYLQFKINYLKNIGEEYALSFDDILNDESGRMLLK